jgi:hypothetical protein
MKLLLTIALFIFFLHPSGVMARIPGVAQIHIVSTWGGLGSPRHEELIITRKSGSYFANGNPVKNQLVNDLLAAVDAPVIEKPDLDNLGLTQEWLEANAEKGVKEYAEAYFQMAAPNLQALYLASFKNQSLIGNLLPSLLRGGWTDDYPGIEVEITEDSGAKVLVTSTEQQLFMLPWEVSGDGQTVKTYNIDISRAIAALLPAKFTNRARVAGEGFRRVLADAVMQNIKGQWESLDAENKAGEYIEILKGSYSIKSVEVNGYHGVDYGKEWVNGDSTQDNLQAILKHKDLPENFLIGIALPYVNGRVENVDVFISSIERYRKLIFSVPWLNEYIAAHPKDDFELRFVGDRSFSEKAMQSFAADMKPQGKEALISEVAAVQRDASLLVVDYRTWLIVLPDKRVVFWRFNGSNTVQKWKEEKFATWDCSYQGTCVGAIISQDGILISK